MTGGYETPAECLEELDRLEAETGRRYSMSLHREDGLYRPFGDGGRLRDTACNTKKMFTVRSEAKRSLKALRRQGRRALVLYPCWYSRGGAHFHLGNPPGEQTYMRPGRIFG